MKTYYNRNENNNKLLYQQNFGFKTFSSYFDIKFGKNLINKIPDTFEIKKEKVNKTEISTPISIG